MINGKQIHELIDKYLITPSDLGKKIGKKDYDDMATEINLLTEFPNDSTPSTLKEDLKFLQEMHDFTQKLLNGKYDITIVEQLDKMVEDWIDLIESADL